MDGFVVPCELGTRALTISAVSDSARQGWADSLMAALTD